jgi:16S rRNA (guanine527-N7)-methyltransferase
MNKDKVQFELLNKLKFKSEDISKLSIFHDELLRFNKKYNLISRSTESDVWNRHILDSAQLVKYIDFEDGKSLADMGSGGGFPGIILAIFNKNFKFHVKLYEKSNIKCDFLENVKNKLNLRYEIFGRYQEEQIHSEYVVSRAFKKLDEILRISREIIKVNHKLIVLKGKNAENEINKLQQPLEFIYYRSY